MSEMVNLFVTGEERDAMLQHTTTLPSIQITDKALADLEVLTMGGFSPLDHFMGSDEVISVTEQMKLLDGSFFPAPVILSVLMDDLPDNFDRIVLRDRFYNTIAIMDVQEAFGLEEYPDLICLAGDVMMLNMPKHDDFVALRMKPSELQNSEKFTAYSPKAPMRIKDSSIVEKLDGNVFLHPCVGDESVEDLAYYAKVKSYQFSVDEMKTVKLALNPMVVDNETLAGVLLHALVEKNFGASAVVMNQKWKDVAEEYAQKMDMEFVFFDLDEDDFDVNRNLSEEVYTKEVLEILSTVYPERKDQGLVLWFTGLSGSGKSTIANLVAPQLLAHGRQLTVLDGDVVRTYLSKGLGFSPEDRDTNIMRIGFVAAEIAKHNGTVICAAISPFRKTREAVRELVGSEKFIEIFIATTLEEAEARDVKGLYAKARTGEIKDFTGIGSPYEAPENPEIVVHTKNKTPLQCAKEIIEYLLAEGYIS